MRNSPMLSESELDWLETMLLARIDEDAQIDGKDEGILGVSELDGFLTAVVSGPTTLMPSLWMSAMYGDFEPVWDSIEDVERFTSLLMRHSNGIVAALMSPAAAFEPLFYERKVEGRTYTIVDEWCEGYLRGVRLDGGAWRAGGPEIEALLHPIRAFTGASEWEAHASKDEEEVERLQGQVASSAMAIHAFWLARRSETPAPVRRRAPRVGRNDPCPCGSGKKYKRCCLLH